MEKIIELLKKSKYSKKTIKYIAKSDAYFVYTSLSGLCGNTTEIFLKISNDKIKK